jgi:hypothetical protein
MLGADDTVQRRSGRKINANGGYRDAVRPSKSYVIRRFGLKWVSVVLLVAVPWSRRVWALPFLTARCWPADERGLRRHKTGREWGRQMSKQVRRWLPERRWYWSSMAASPRCPGHWRVSKAAWRWFPVCAGMRASIIRPSLSPQASAAANPRKGGANGACRPGRAAPTPPGKTSKWPGTAVNASSYGSFPTPPCGTPPACPRSPAALWWWLTSRGSCGWKPFAVPTSSLRQRKSWDGPSCVDRSR